MEEHISECKLTLIDCPNNECDEKPTRVDLPNHLEVCPQRRHECKFCREKGTFQSITKVHVKECDKRTVQCPKCREEMQKCRLGAHISNDCKNAKIACEVCKTEVKRKNFKQHQKEVMHIIMLKEKARDTTARYFKIVFLSMLIVGALLFGVLYMKIEASEQRMDEKLAASEQRADEKLAASEQRADEKLAASEQRMGEKLAELDKETGEQLTPIKIATVILSLAVAACVCGIGLLIYCWYEREQGKEIKQGEGIVHAVEGIVHVVLKLIIDKIRS